MTEWLDLTLGDCIELKRGYDLPNAQRKAGPFPVISSSGPSNFHSEAKAKAPGVVTGRYGTIGQVFFTTSDFWPLNTSLYVRDFKGNDPRFVYYFLKTLDWAKFNDKSGVPGVNRNDAHLEPVKLPPLSEQRSIAAILAALDDKIELNRKTAATLEEMARALYRSWFVDFDPVWAKAEGRTPAHMDEATAALFPDSFGDDGLPVGWSRGLLANISRLNPESHSKKSYPHKVRYVDLANTKWGLIDATTDYDKETAPSRARLVLRAGDTIVGTVRPGNGSYAYVGSSGLTGSTGFAVLRPIDEADAGLLYLAATDPATIDDLANLADGGAYPAVRPDVVANQPMNVAPDAVKKAFSLLVTTFIARIEETKKENQTLASLRDTLLPKLMSGELRVGEAQELVEEVA
jgi:type I restriction enzyme, S subunit